MPLGFMADLFNEINDAVLRLYAAAILCLVIFIVILRKRKTITKEKKIIAERILEKFYQAKKAISHIRSHLFLEQIKIEINIDNNEEKDNDYLDRLYAYTTRLNYKNNIFKELQGLMQAAIHYFGRDIEPYFIELNKIMNRITKSAESLCAIYWSIQNNDCDSHEKSLNISEDKHFHESIIWEGYCDDKDEIKEDVDRIIAGVEKILGPYL